MKINFKFVVTYFNKVTVIIIIWQIFSFCLSNIIHK